MNKLIIPVGIILLLALTFAWLLQPSATPSDPPAVKMSYTTSTPLLHQLREQAELIVLKVDLSTVVTARITNWIGGIKCCVIVWGVASIGTDMDQAALQILYPKVHVARLILAEPKLLSIGLDANRCTIYDTRRTGLWVLAPFSTSESTVIAAAYRQGQEQLGQMLDMTLYRTRARQQIEAVVQQLARQLDWRVEVVWADDKSHAGG